MQTFTDIDTANKKIEELTKLTTDQLMMIIDLHNLKLSNDKVKKESSVFKKVLKGATVVVSVVAVIGLAISVGRCVADNNASLDSL